MGCYSVGLRLQPPHNRPANYLRMQCPQKSRVAVEGFVRSSCDLEMDWSNYNWMSIPLLGSDFRIREGVLLPARGEEKTPPDEPWLVDGMRGESPGLCGFQCWAFMLDEKSCVPHRAQM
jgi:hypothetical protein